MSRFILLVLTITLLAIGTGQAQQNAVGSPMGGKIFKTSDNFLGTWEWRSGTDVFRLTITRDQAYMLPNGNYGHVLIGRHSYSKSGVVLEDSYSINPSIPQSCSLFSLPEDDWSLTFMFHDITRNKWGQLDLIISSGAPNQMYFTLAERHGITSKTIVRGFTVPTTMTLTRVP